jgi:hypothetical protein
MVTTATRSEALPDLPTVSEFVPGTRRCTVLPFSRWRPDCVAGHIGLEVRREAGKE